MGLRDIARKVMHPNGGDPTGSGGMVSGGAPSGGLLGAGLRGIGQLFHRGGSGGQMPSWGGGTFSSGSEFPFAGSPTVPNAGMAPTTTAPMPGQIPGGSFPSSASGSTPNSPAGGSSGKPQSGFGGAAGNYFNGYHDFMNQLYPVGMSNYVPSYQPDQGMEN